MIIGNTSKCPRCGGELKHYDKVVRVVKSKYGQRVRTSINRLRCVDCKGMHRHLPDTIFPYKHYESDIIRGVMDGIITSDTLGFEDYPCEMTMKRWLLE